MKKTIYLLIIIIVAFYGCSKDSELSDSIYIADTEYPALPKYTEWGYNTFGANYERSTFTYTTDQIPLKITTKNDTLALIFQGRSSNEYPNNMTLRFSFYAPKITNYKDLLSFDDRKINFKDDNVRVEMIINDNAKFLNILGGDFHFIRAQTVYVDDEEEQIVLSGTFSLKFIENEIPESMSDGRFDFGIKDNIFFDLN